MRYKFYFNLISLMVKNIDIPAYRTKFRLLVAYELLPLKVTGLYRSDWRKLLHHFERSIYVSDV